jgi:hypothetical protein
MDDTVDRRLGLLRGRLGCATRPGFVAIDEEDSEVLVYLESVNSAWRDGDGDIWVRITDEVLCFRGRTAEWVWLLLTSYSGVIDIRDTTPPFSDDEPTEPTEEPFNEF